MSSTTNGHFYHRIDEIWFILWYYLNEWSMIVRVLPSDRIEIIKLTSTRTWHGISCGNRHRKIFVYHSRTGYNFSDDVSLIIGHRTKQFLVYVGHGRNWINYYLKYPQTQIMSENITPLIRLHKTALIKYWFEDYLTLKVFVYWIGAFINCFFFSKPSWCLTQFWPQNLIYSVVLI